MPKPITCPGCYSQNKPEEVRCRVCGRLLSETKAVVNPGPPVILQRVMSGEVFTARLGDARRGRRNGTPDDTGVVQVMEAPVPEDHSDVLADAVERIRAKAATDGERFKPYAPSKKRRPTTPEAKEEVAQSLHTAVGLFRERAFEDAIEHILKAIARDDEDRRSWILLAEAYLRVGRPYKAAVGYLRALELRPKDEQGWLGLARVLRAIDDLPAAATVIDRATEINPHHADSWSERGAILESLQNLSEAMKSFAKVLEIRPDHPVAQAKQRELESRVANVPLETALEEPASRGIETSATTNAPESTSTIPEGLLADMDEVLGADEEWEAADAPRDETKPAAGPSPERPVARGPRPPRVRMFVDGLDETLEGGVPWGHVVLIAGAPGTMKSSLAFSILVNNAAKQGLHCLYLSLEERASSLLKQMGSLGMKLDVPKGSLVVLDPRTATDLMGDRPDWVDGLRQGIESIRDQRGLDLVVIDSLEALEVLAKFKDRRRELYRLFEWLRDLDVTAFVVTERPDWVIAGHVLQGRWDEDFLADGVFHLRMHLVTDLEAQRRLRVVKMRGSKHDTGYLVFLLDDGGFRVTRAMSQ